MATGRKARDARYYAAHRDKIKAKVTTWQTDNPNRAAQNHARYRANNPDKIRVRWVAQRAVRKGARGTHTAEEIAAMFVAQNGCCAACRADIDGGYEQDHVMPLARGGTNDIGNIQLLCRPCNRKKHAKHPDDWAKEVATWQP
jgi:5-methylcytosine-specific restriction endonuclease McrA